MGRLPAAGHSAVRRPCVVLRICGSLVMWISADGGQCLFSSVRLMARSAVAVP